MLRGRSFQVQTFLRLAPRFKLRVGPVFSLASTEGWGVVAAEALPVGAEVFTEPPRLSITNRGAHSSQLWALVEEALEAGFICGSVARSSAAREPILLWDAENAASPLTVESLGFECPSPSSFPEDLRAPWLEWDATDYMEAAALAAKYHVSCDDVQKAFVDLARTSLCTSSDGRGFYPVLATMNHACVANVVVEDRPGDLKKVTTLRDVKAGEELFSCYASARWSRPASVSLRRQYMLRTFGFRCACDACQYGTALAYMGPPSPRAMHVPECFV